MTLNKELLKSCSASCRRINCCYMPKSVFLTNSFCFVKYLFSGKDSMKTLLSKNNTEGLLLL